MKSSQSYFRIALGSLLLACTTIAYAQALWQRPYGQWTKDDVIKVASDSPWAQVVQVSPTIGDHTPVAYLPAVTVRLRSSMPIRQALVRLKQIGSRYDKMSDVERAEFDTRTKGLLECPACADNYIVTLGPPVSTRQLKSGIPGLRNAAVAVLQGRVYLANDRGERRELTHFVAPKHDDDEATFFFARLDDKGAPLLTAESKKLIFIFEAKNIRTAFGLDTIPERCEFDVAKLLQNGKVEF
jgi:hypothetical protein